MSAIPPPPATFPPPPAAPRPTSALVPQAEPTVDEIRRDVNEVHLKLDEINVCLSQLQDQRDGLISAPTFEPASQVALSALLSKTKGLMGSVVSPVGSIINRLSLLNAAVEAHQAAATSQEVEVIAEEVEVLKLNLNQTLNLIKSTAWEEAQAEPEAVARLAAVVRAENGAMDEQAVAGVVGQAMLTAKQRMDRVDVLSYAGRVKCQMPFVELSEVVSELLAQGQFGSSLGRVPSHLSERTLVNPTDSILSKYSKVGEEEEDDVDLLDASTRFAGGIKAAEEQYGETGWDLEGGRNGRESNGAYEDEVKEVKGPLGAWTLRWRDWLVRAGLGLSIFLVVGGIGWWIAENPSGGDDSSSSSVSGSQVATATAAAKAAASAAARF